MPKSRNRSNKAIKRQAFKQFRGIKVTQQNIIQVLQNFNNVLNQHANVINAQRDKIKLLDLRVQLLEEKVYAGLTQEERDRLGDIIEAASNPPADDKQPETTPAADASELPIIDAEVVEEPAPADADEGAKEQPAA